MAPDAVHRPANKSFCAELLPPSFCAERSGVAESIPPPSGCCDFAQHDKSLVRHLPPSFCAQLLSPSFCAERSGVAESIPPPYGCCDFAQHDKNLRCESFHWALFEMPVCTLATSVIFNLSQSEAACNPWINDQQNPLQSGQV